MDRYLIVPDMIPDLDGVACAIAYAEYWQKKGFKVAYGIPKISRLEPEFVLRELDLSVSQTVDTLISDFPQVIVVDTSNPQRISPVIAVNQVVEVVDHRQFNLAHEFPQAKIQVELVGAAATLIAEKFYNENIPISEKTAALLYCAIISNTINFKALVTTDRDIKMAEWLKEKALLPEDFIHRMFAYKSVYKPTKEELIEEMASFEIKGLKVAMIQLEMIQSEEFISSHLDELRQLMKEIKSETHLDWIALSGIDVEKGYNTIFVLEKEYQKVIGKSLAIKFENDIAKSDRVWMRKEIAPKMRDVIESLFPQPK